MFDTLRKWFTSSPAAPAAPVKVPGAVHPLVAANRAKPRAMAVGIVYDRNGVPKISPDFIAALSAPDRTWVANDLLRHGWQLNADDTVTKLED